PRAPSPRELRRTPPKSRSRARGSPSTRFSWSSSQHARRDDDALDLARALVDLGDPRVAVVPLDGELGRVPVAAVDLDGLVRDPRGGLAREELRLGALHRVTGARVLHGGGAPREQAR